MKIVLKRTRFLIAFISCLCLFTEALVLLDHNVPENYEDLTITTYVTEMAKWPVNDLNKLNKHYQIPRNYTLVKITSFKEQRSHPSLKELRLELADVANQATIEIENNEVRFKTIFYNK